MSPILKRDIHEQLKHAKRLALAAAGRSSDDDRYKDEGEYDWEDGHGDVVHSAPPRIGDGGGSRNAKRELSYASGSNPRQGIGVDDIAGDVHITGEWRESMKRSDSETGRMDAHARRKSVQANAVWEEEGRLSGYELDEEEQEVLVKWPSANGGNGWGAGLYPPASHTSDHHDHAGREGLHRVSSRLTDDSHGPLNMWTDLRNLLFEVCLILYA